MANSLNGDTDGQEGDARDKMDDEKKRYLSL